ALGVYQETTAELRPALARLARLTRDNTRQGERIARLKALNERIMRMRGDSIAIVDRGAATPALRARWIDESVPVLVAIRAVGREMIEDERRLLVLREGVAQASARTFIVVLGVVGVLVVVLAILIFLTLVRYTSDLTASRDTLRDLADTLEDAVRERTADLTRANEEIQRFAYIVSHDLRAPLVNVLGFTSELESAAQEIAAFVDVAERDAPNLPSDAARIAAREDLPEAIGFIRSSTQKMDRLINAILKLAREGRRAVTPERIDMAALAGAIADTLRHRVERIGATIRIDPSLPPIVSDRLAVEQILSNLIENAVKYLQPDRAGIIEVRGRIQAGRASFEITDNGRGIDPRDHQRIFDLFRRSGVQDQPGEGIGLAHVRAMAYRLGGTIDVDSRLGEGSVFRLSLPATMPQLQEP
ncbi:MAG: CHASE3 domain-containing protein, partial [Sphingomonas sp.]|nr:CHASE3 domain-containing protein [Sphingomonas sp.]